MFKITFKYFFLYIFSSFAILSENSARYFNENYMYLSFGCNFVSISDTDSSSGSSSGSRFLIENNLFVGNNLK